MLRPIRRPEPPRPLFRGDVVTICIAAKCQRHNQMIFISDRLISGETDTTESVGPKFARLGDYPWIGMFAGEAPRFGPLWEQIVSRIKENTLHAVIAACEEAFKAELQKRIEMEILLPYGWNREEFFDAGKAKLDEYRFGAITDEITKMELGIDLLLGGFDTSGRQHIFEMSSNGTITRIEHLDFHAIGSGKHSALGTLYPLVAFNWDEDLYAVVYRVIAAKFAAERAPGVGRSTWVFLMNSHGKPNALMMDDVDKLRPLWEPTAKPPIPTDALEIIEQGMLPGDGLEPEGGKTPKA